MDRVSNDDQRIERGMRDRQAVDFDAWYLRDKGLWYHKAEVDSVLAALACKADDIVLDAGSGTGRVSVLIAPKVRRLVCVDFSVESLRILRRRLPPGLSPQVHCIAGDLSIIVTQGVRFTKVVSIQVLQHIPSHDRRLSLLQTLHGLLGDGGRLVLTAFRWGGAVWTDKEGYYAGKLYRYAFEPDELKALVEAAGFGGVRVRPLIVQHLRLQRFGLWTTHLDRTLARFLSPKRFGQFLLVTASKG